MNSVIKIKPGHISMAGLLLGICMLVVGNGLKYYFTPSHIIVNSGQIAALLLLAVGYVIKYFNLYLKSSFRQRISLVAPFIPAVIAITAYIFGALSAGTLLWFAQMNLVCAIVIVLGRFFLKRAANTEQPTNALIISFVTIIIAGASLLLLPGMHKESISVTDAVFTSTSAVCVTGLAVCDTATDFTRAGQFVIFALIQIGGLGIMIFGALFAVMLGSKLSMKEAVAMRDIMNEQNFGDLSRKVLFICITTFAIEFVGMCFLLTVPLPDKSLFDKCFFAMFHAVSAFCNAGFSLQSDSLVSFRECWQVYWVICPLIILGGLGFPVMLNLFDIARFKYNQLSSYNKPLRSPQLRLQSKLVIWSSLILLVGGTLLLWICELAKNCSIDQPVSLLDCFFNSITARTAGFNTIDFSQLNAAAKMVMIALMSVGGSPASTAGGIKTITVAIMVLTIISTMKKQSSVDIFNRSISVAMVRRSLVLVAIFVLLLWLVTLLLIITENSTGSLPLDLAFEAASALGTVGLSTGVTGELTTAGKWIIIFSMLAGRLGPLSLLTALTISPRRARYSYPHEPLIIG